GIRLFYVYVHLSSQTSYYLAYLFLLQCYSCTNALTGYLRISHYDSRITFQLSVRVTNAHHVGYVSLLRSEEHTSELQSRFDLVCRLLLEKKKHNHLFDNINIS